MLLLRAHHPKTTVEECIVVLSGDGMVDLFQKGDLGIAAVPVETNVVKAGRPSRMSVLCASYKLCSN